nr:diguanylate cyclase [Azoarcus sp. L1K30]
MFAAGATLSLRRNEDNLADRLQEKAVRLQSIYEVSTAELEHEARALAYSMATDAEIGHILGEAGRDQRASKDSNSPRARELRMALGNRLSLLWQEMQAQFDLRQLQLLLTPDLTSFLRLHAPEDYGDSLMDVRPMLRSIQADRVPRGGFEIGRAFAGIRGGAAVLHPVTAGLTIHTRGMEAGREIEHVGTLEVGIGLDGLIARLSRTFNVSIAVLLDTERVTQAMWTRYQPGSLDASPSACCIVLSSTGTEAGEWLNRSLIDRGTEALQSRLMPWNGKTLQLIRFPFRDYLGTQDPSVPRAGTILIWRDASADLAAHQEARVLTIRNALLAYAVVQLIVLGALRITRREWQRQLDEQTATTERLARQNSLLLNTAGEGIYGVDADGRATFINPSALEMLKFSEQDILGRNQHELFHHHYEDGSPYPASSCPVFETLQDGRRRRAEDRFIRADGTEFPVSMTVTPIEENACRKGAVVVFRDITELTEKRQQLLRLATTDPLTGTSNRRHFLDVMETELARLKRRGGVASLLMTDLDHFKRINDLHGHAAGDEVLKHFVAIVRETLRKTDVVGRIGGEEFAILLPGEDKEGARELAERLRESLENSPSIVGEKSIPCTVSIGIAALRANDTSADAVLQRADEALYTAKRTGRNRAVVGA